MEHANIPQGREVLSRIIQLTQSQIAATKSGEMEEFLTVETQRKELIEHLFNLIPEQEMHPLYESLRELETLNGELMTLADDTLAQAKNELLKIKRSEKAKQAYKQSY